MPTPRGQPRPSHKELDGKVRDALAALRDGRCYVADPKHLGLAYELLGIVSEAELWLELEAVLEELRAVPPGGCYKGRRPPEKSYEPKIHGCELLAYAWQSARLGRAVYLKFTFKRNDFWFLDFHEDNP